jgi:AAA15 family ATPase/GTPase
MSNLKELYIEKFRSLTDITIPLSPCLTVISGQNATQKTTILGMLAQPFGLKSLKTIYDKSFQAKFNESFKISKEFDRPGEHSYQISFLNEELFREKKAIVKSFKRDDSIRFVQGKVRGKGDGNIDFPVIYLTLKRVYPIGELAKAKKNSISMLKPAELEYFQSVYNRLICENESINVSHVTSASIKNTLAPHSNDYDGLVISAGQDNIGQIIGAIISFQRAKKSLKSDYLGGLLLIDELDATIHTNVREEIVDWLLEEAKELSLQVVFTTHAIDMLEYLHEKHKPLKKSDTQIIYLTKRFGAIEVLQNPTIEEIRADLANKTINKPKNRLAPKEKINVFCEDKEAESFLKLLLPNDIKKRIQISALELGCEELKKLARNKNAYLSHNIFCLDGDTPFTKGQFTNNIALLPGKDEKLSPEMLFKNYLNSVTDGHTFFRNSPNKYTKKAFLRRLPKKVPSEKEKLRVIMKQWFKKEQKEWGGGFSRLFKSWKNDNQAAVKSFLEKFITTFNFIAAKKKTPGIATS